MSTTGSEISAGLIDKHRESQRGGRTIIDSIDAGGIVRPAREDVVSARTPAQIVDLVCFGSAGRQIRRKVGSACPYLHHTDWAHCHSIRARRATYLMSLMLVHFSFANSWSSLRVLPKLAVGAWGERRQIKIPDVPASAKPFSRADETERHRGGGHQSGTRGRS